MLTCASAVFASVPAVFVDPFSLAACQMEGMCGYVAVSYAGRRLMCDLLFLSGHAVERIGRLTAESRLFVPENEVRDSVAASRSEPGTTVSLFQVGRGDLDRFAATFAIEPALKILLGMLSRRQLHDLLTRSGCKHAILEFLDPSKSPPRIHQVEFTSGHAFPDPPRGFRSGRLFLYDISPSAIPKGRLLDPPVLKPDGSPERDPGAFPPVAPARSAPSPPVAPARAGLSPPAAPVRAEPPPPVPPQPADLSESQGTVPSDTGLQLFPPPQQVRPAGPKVDARTGSAAAGPQPTAPDPEFSRPFERLYRTFRTITADQVGGRSEEMFNRGLQRARRSRPGFDPSCIGPDDVQGLMGMLEAIVAGVPVLKRGRFRSAARGALAEFYDRNYELLERNRVLDPVQALYSKLSS